MKIFISILSTILCLSVVLNGQAKLLSPHILSTSEGLSDNTNEFIYRDSRGFMWYSSENGVNRYDGKNVKVYKQNSNPNSLNGANIQSNFFEDSIGNLWFCTYEAINCYRRKTDDFISFQITINQAKVLSDYYAFFLENKQKLWLLLRGQIIQFDIYSQKADVLAYKLNFKRAKVVTDLNGNIKTILGYKYGTTTDLEILHKEKNNAFRFEKHIITSRLGNNMPIKTNDLISDSAQTFWLATDKGVLLYDLEKKKVIDSVKTLGALVFSSIFKESNNRLVAVSKKNGIYIINLSQKTIEEHFDSNQYPRFSSLRDAYLDNMSNLWLSEWYKGITYFNLKKSKFRYLFHTNKEEDKISIVRIAEDKKGQIWSISSQNKVYIFDRKSNKKTEINLANLNKETKDVQIVDLICDDLGLIYIFSTRNIYVYSPDIRLLAVKYFPFKDKLFYAQKLSNNRIILSSTDSLGLLELVLYPKMEIIPFPSDKKNEKKDILNIYESQEGLLFVNLNQESIVVLKKNVQSYKLEKNINFSSLHYVFYEPKNDSNLMWIGTSKGLLKFDKKHLEIIEQIDEEKGLLDQFIYGIVPISDEVIMLSTGKGLVPFNTKNYKTHRFTIADGLQDEMFNNYAFLKASDGTVWLGGVNGINFFKPNDIKLLDELAYPHIVNLKVNDEDWQSSINITEVKELTFPFSQRTLTFDLVAIEYSDPKNNLLQYRLKNYDEKWLTVKNTEGAVRYANLPSGTYYLQVKAANSDGVWNDTIRELKITILTPWYKTWWFITLCIVATMTLIGYIIYLRLSKIIDLQDIRIKLYENLHDDLGSRLTAIVMAIDGILVDIKTPKTAESNIETQSKTLTEIRTVGSRIVGNMHLLVWATSPENDELSNVVQQMRTDKDMLLPKAQLVINMDEALKNLKIDGNKRYQMLSIFDEALTNISKYAYATVVTVSLECTNDMFSLTINDNGKGFDSETPKNGSPFSGGNGFRNMRNRAKRINGQLKITSSLGKGSTIVLIFSLREISFFQRLKRVFSKFSPK